MTRTIGRPVEFVESKQDTFCTLVGVGVPRRHAAASVGISPSTVSRHMAADPRFAERVIEAETECEIDLLRRVRLQSERSWRAAVWLLERMRPERYARGKATPAAPWNEMFDKLVALIDTEIEDESLRARLTQRLDEMALEELKTPALDDPGGAANPGEPAEHAEVSSAKNPSSAVPATKVGVGSPIRAVRAAASNAMPHTARRVASPPHMGKLDEVLSRLAAPAVASDRTLDFCNTSPADDAHERRALAALTPITRHS